MSKEYIDREAAKELLWLELDGITHAVIACRLINDVPAADVVEVVRCKDCIGKSTWYKDDYGNTICGLSGFFVTTDADYCSYGERKDNV